MVSTVQPGLPGRIYAEASVRSVGGVSLFRTLEPITKENVTQFHSEPRLINLAAEGLRAEGFEVLEQGQITISIAGSPEVYQRVFQTKIKAENRSVIKEGGHQTTATFLDTIDTDIVGFIDASHSPLADVLEGVAINEPAYYFDLSIPQVTPPNKHQEYWYLDVPSDVAKILNAQRAHREGFRGRGVKVVMVDTGWYRHPFFSQHGYNAKVVLGPGTVNRDRDQHGHGTGESANLFAVAPDVEFTMVKADVIVNNGKSKNVNSIAALKKAISLQPDIISCSWGSDQEYKALSAYDQALAATVAEAVNQGIIVIFAAGNGHWGFPAQHPDVIAAGGVYMSDNGILEASDYASGFSSHIYSRRFVPDVCGLVGKRPRGAYIMLPVPPGSPIDRELALEGTKYPDIDETDPDDGWAVFSGTSAAAPQLAGICALMKQANPNLSPTQAQEILKQTARDVSRGFSSSRTGGHEAGFGVDLATGSGLADAYQAVLTVQHQANQIKPEKQTKQKPQQLSRNIKKVKIMDPILKLNLEDIVWQINEKLQELQKDNQEMQELEFVPNEANFVPLSTKTKAANALKKTLKDDNLELRISAAEGLLKLGYYKKSAIQTLYDILDNITEEQLDNTFLPESIQNPLNDEIKIDLLKSRVIKALGEINSKTNDMELPKTSSTALFGEYKWDGNGQCVCVDHSTGRKTVVSSDECTKRGLLPGSMT
ncbi:MAG: S8 family serine peptidase [Nostocaceae cyanobacterium]|nr:S8 family serine peptidase [Nostocaceae cyanobacterium]